MFAGIIEHKGVVMAASPIGGAGALRLSLDLGPLAEGLKLGASVAVNGACLTACEVRNQTAAFDVVAETLRRTTLGSLKVGDTANLERSLRLGDRIDGHFVQGHVDGVGRVVANESRGGGWLLDIEPDADLHPFLAFKGSIAIDGVSLTIADIRAGVISIALIPTTLERTCLAARRPSDRVNIETDILARMIVARVDAILGVGTAKVADGDDPLSGGKITAGLTLSRLREAGFLK